VAETAVGLQLAGWPYCRLDLRRIAKLSWPGVVWWTWGWKPDMQFLSAKDHSTLSTLIVR